MKKILMIGLVLVLSVLFVGCNAQIIDTTYSFERGIIDLKNGETVEGEIQSWLDYENSDMVQVKINNKTYLTHSTNVILISE